MISLLVLCLLFFLLQITLEFFLFASISLDDHDDDEDDDDTMMMMIMMMMR